MLFALFLCQLPYAPEHGLQINLVLIKGLLNDGHGVLDRVNLRLQLYQLITHCILCLHILNNVVYSYLLLGLLPLNLLLDLLVISCHSVNNTVYIAETAFKVLNFIVQDLIVLVQGSLHINQVLAGLRDFFVVFFVEFIEFHSNLLRVHLFGLLVLGHGVAAAVRITNI